MADQEPLPLAVVPPRPVVMYCTYCGDPHAVIGGLMDPRYAMGRCEGDSRPLVADAERARFLANSVGKWRPKGTPLGKGTLHYLVDAEGRKPR